MIIQPATPPPPPKASTVSRPSRPGMGRSGRGRRPQSTESGAERAADRRAQSGPGPCGAVSVNHQSLMYCECLPAASASACFARIRRECLFSACQEVDKNRWAANAVRGSAPARAVARLLPSGTRQRGGRLPTQLIPLQHAGKRTAPVGGAPYSPWPARAVFGGSIPPLSLGLGGQPCRLILRARATRVTRQRCRIRDAGCRRVCRMICAVAVCLSVACLLPSSPSTAGWHPAQRREDAAPGLWPDISDWVLSQAP